MKEKRKESIIMPAKKKHPVRLEELTPDEKVKYEIAEELGPVSYTHLTLPTTSRV